MGLYCNCTKAIVKLNDTVSSEPTVLDDIYSRLSRRFLTDTKSCSVPVICIHSALEAYAIRCNRKQTRLASQRGLSHCVLVRMRVRCERFAATCIYVAENAGGRL